MCDEKCRVGVGLPDSGRCRLVIKDGKAEIHAGASCIGQGLGTVLTQVVSQTAELDYEQIVLQTEYIEVSRFRYNVGIKTDIADRRGGAKRAALKLKEALSGKTLEELNETEYYGEYLRKPIRWEATCRIRYPHVAYGYATQVCVLNEDGTIKKMIGAMMSEKQ